MRKLGKYYNVINKGREKIGYEDEGFRGEGEREGEPNPQKTAIFKIYKEESLLYEIIFLFQRII